MWTRKRANFLLIRISHGRWRRIMIIVPLFVFDITLAAMKDLAWLGDRLLHWTAANYWEKPPSFEATLIICGDLIEEMRKYGRWRPVVVENKTVKIAIDFF